MIKEHKNKLLEILINCGYTIDDVSFYENEDNCEITFNNTPFSFVMEYGKYSFNSYHIGQTLFTHDYKMSYSPSEMAIENIYTQFEAWINNSVNKYFKNRDDIDMWEVLANSSKFIHPNFIDFNDRSNFDDFEKEQIRLVMDEFKLRIPEYVSVDKKEIEIIYQKLDYLASKLDSMNKFDWKSLFVSIIVGITINMTVDSSTGLTLLDLFKSLFTRIPKLLN